MLSRVYWFLYRGNYDWGKGFLTFKYLDGTGKVDRVNKVDTEMGVA